jgi:hypothetical protein
MLDKSTNRQPKTKLFERIPGAFRASLLILVCAWKVAAAVAPVRLESATPIQICSSCTEVHVLLVPDEKSSVKIGEAPKVEEVYLGGADPRDATKFSAKWISDKFPRQISITLDPDQTKQAGTYDVYLNLQPESNPGAGRLKVQVSRPAATIEAIPKLIIDRTYWFIGTSSDTHPELRVNESSKKSGLSISSIRQPSNASVGTEPIGGQLNVVVPKTLIGLGEQAKLSYSLGGDFRLGTATGSLKIDAPQLANPVSFDFEVHSRVHWIYIGVTIALGLVASYLVKVRLQQKIELDQARLDAQKLVERVEREALRHADPTFLGAYQNQLTALRDAMNGNPAEINAAKMALDNAWQASLQALSRRHQDQLDALDKLHDITNYSWLVPPGVVQAIDQARARQVHVAQLIEGDDLTHAAAERQQIIIDLGNGIRDATMAWQTKEQQVLAALQTGPSGISVEVSAVLAKPANDLLGTLHKIDASTQLNTPEQIQQALSDIKFQRSSAQQFFQWLSNAIEMEYASAEALVPDPLPPGWDRGKFGAIAPVVHQFTAFLGSLVDQPNPPALPAQLGSVQRAWSDGLQGQFDAMNPAVKAQLDARDYVQATKVAVQERAGPGAPMSAVSSGATEPAFRAPTFYRDMIGAATIPMYAIRTRFQEVATPTAAAPTSFTDAATLKRDKLTQSLVVGLLLIVAGYGLQFNSFVGTFVDFSTLFFWAFALDQTVDQLGRIVKKN